MGNYKIAASKKWEYENGFYLTRQTKAVDEFFEGKNIQLVKNGHYKIPVYPVKP